MKASNTLGAIASNPKRLNRSAGGAIFASVDDKGACIYWVKPKEGVICLLF